MTPSRLLLAVSLIALAGCGRVSELKPEAGHSLPVKPLLARATPTANELLTPPTYARPDRVDELMKRSTARKADPFDLPPATGGAAAALPAGTDLTPVTDDTGPVKPQ
jgi:hypothetical protein